MTTMRPARRATTAVSAAVAILVVVPPVAATPDPPRGDLLGPLDSVRAVTPFDLPPERWLPGHRGVDLASDTLAEVRAPADGTISFAGAVAGRPVLSVDHGGGLRTTYEPVRATVDAGDAVTAGQTVGYVLAGHSGCPVPVCLHWGARRSSGDAAADDEYVDPMSLLAADDRPIRLKPLRPGDASR